MKIVIMLGAPGAGKGTIASRINEKLPGTVHLSSGDLLRGAVKAGTVAGLEAKGYMDAGKLVPDTLIASMIEEYIGANGAIKLLILDGFPRTVPQAEMLDQALAKRGEKVDSVIKLNVPDALVLERLGGRRMCPACGAGYHVLTLPPQVEGVCDACQASLITRSDDNPETIANRLSVYHQQTVPLVDLYDEKGILCSINAAGELSLIVEDTVKALA